MDKDFDFDLDLDIDPTAMEPTAPLPENSRKKRGFPKWIIAVAAAVVVLAGVGFGVRALGSRTDPLQQTVKGLKSNETVAFLSQTAKSGDVRLELGLKELLDVDGSISLGLRTDCTSLEKAKTALTLALKMKQNTVADLSLYASTRELVLSSDAFLPNQALGVDLSRFRENLPGSVFDPDSDTDYALDAEIFDALRNVNPADAGKNAEQLAKKTQAVYDSAMKMLGKSVKAHANKDKGTDMLHFGDETVKVSVITYTVDTEAIHAITLDALHWARDSKELKSLLELVAEDYPALVEETKDMDSQDWLEEFYAGLDDAIKQLEALTDDPEKLADSFDEAEITARVSISRDKGEILGLSLTVKDRHGSRRLSVSAGPSMARLNSINVQYDDGDDKYSGSYTVKTNDGERFESALKLRHNADSVLDADFRWNKADGSFTLQLPEDITVQGVLTQTDGGYQAVVDTLHTGDGDLHLELRLSVAGSVRLGDAPAYREVTALREAELEELAEDLQDAVYTLMYSNSDIRKLIFSLIFS